MARAKNKKKMSTRERVIVGISIGLIVISVLVVGGLFVMNYNFFQDSTGGALDDDIKTPSSIKEDVTTFLVLGISDDEEERKDTALTDTIMVVTCDIKQKKVSVLQIPRDTFVGPETPTGKINAIYKQDSSKWDYAGITGLSKMINEMFQINIDHYVTIKMNGFKQLVDSIGGVEMDVPVDMELNGTTVKAGPQVLNGEQAIAVVRTRNVYKNADLGRLETQRLFMSGLVDKCLNLGIGDMAKLLPTAMANITTDLNTIQALDYFKVIKGMDMSNISIMTVPGDAAMNKGQSVYSVYPNRTAKMLNDYFRPYSDPVPAEQLQINSIKKEPPMSEEDGVADTLDQYQSGTE